MSLLLHAPAAPAQEAPGARAPLKITTDIACEWSLDGHSQGTLNPNEPVTVFLPLGKHTIRANSAIGMKWESSMDLQSAAQETVKISFNKEAEIPHNQGAHMAGAARVNSKDGLTYLWIPPGEFQMGCSVGDNQCNADEKPPHAVRLTRGFWLGQTPVTQAAYKRVTGKNPSLFHDDSLPVEQVSWEEAEAYCAAIAMRLPTEAEWEDAARAHTSSAAYANLDSAAWYAVNSGGKTHSVATRAPNAWNLYDMLGNVWQWTADWYDSSYYQRSETQDPKGANWGQFRALRGGSWGNIAKVLRVSGRLGKEPNFHDSYTGFRCAGSEGSIQD